MKGRFLRGLGGHGVGQAITILIQFIQPALLVHYLAPTGYGTFLIAASAASLALFVEAGLPQAIVNHCLRNQTSSARRRLLIQLAFSCYLTRVIVVGAIIAASIAIMLQLSGLPKQMVILVAVNMIIGLLNGFPTLMAARLTVEGRDATGVILCNCLRLCDFFGAAIAAWITQSVVMVMLAILLLRLASAATIIWIQIENTGQICPRRLRTVSRLDKLGLAYLSSNAGSLLVPNLLPAIIGTALTPAAVATFSVCRTLSRVPLQLASVVLGAALPSLTTLASDFGGRKLHAWFLKLSAFLFLATSAALCAINYNPAFLSQVWLGKNLIDPLVLLVLSFATGLGVQNAAFLCLFNASGQRKLILATGTLPPLVLLCITLYAAFGYGLLGAAVAVLCAEGLSAVLFGAVCLRHFNKTRSLTNSGG